MGVQTAVAAELERLGEAAEQSVEGQTALALAAALDDRAGIQAGGLASTAKQLAALMASLRTSKEPGDSDPDSWLDALPSEVRNS